jgi:hypothetical protein
MASDLRFDSLLSSDDGRMRGESDGLGAHESGLRDFDLTGLGDSAWTWSSFADDDPMKERSRRLALLFEPANFPKKTETVRRDFLAVFLGASADTRAM